MAGPFGPLLNFDCSAQYETNSLFCYTRWYEHVFKEKIKYKKKQLKWNGLFGNRYIFGIHFNCLVVASKFSSFKTMKLVDFLKFDLKKEKKRKKCASTWTSYKIDPDLLKF